MNARDEFKRWTWSLVITALFFTFLAPTATAATPAPYRLGHGDAVSVSIVGQPALSVEAQLVRPDGTISLPLLQEQAIQGKTVPEVTALLKSAYKLYLADPQVVVSVAKFRPVRVTLLGQVNRPGTFAFETSPTVADAVATAGGLNERAARGWIKIVLPDGQTRVHDLDELLSGQARAWRLPEGSVVEVGEVWGPDWYRIVPIMASIITASAVLLRYW